MLFNTVFTHETVFQVNFRCVWQLFMIPVVILKLHFIPFLYIAVKLVSANSMLSTLGILLITSIISPTIEWVRRIDRVKHVASALPDYVITEKAMRGEARSNSKKGCPGDFINIASYTSLSAMELNDSDSDFVMVNTTWVTRSFRVW